jgi:hypothetical protein
MPMNHRDRQHPLRRIGELRLFDGLTLPAPNNDEEHDYGANASDDANGSCIHECSFLLVS